MIYIYTILHVTLLCYYQQHQFNDLKGKRDTRWKGVRIGLDCLTFGCLYLAQYYHFTLQDLVFCSGIYWLLFEVLTNVISLGTDMFFVGYSSTVDEWCKRKWLAVFGWFIISLLIKILL